MKKVSKFNELVQKLCPNGVEYKELNKITHYAKRRIEVGEIDENTYVGVENLLQNKQGKTIASSVPISGKVIQFEIGDILIGNIRPYLKKIWLSNCVGGTNGDVLTIQINDRMQIIPEFLYYVLSSEHFFLYDTQNSKGAKMPRGNKEAVMKYKVPVPPMEVQREIVCELDSLSLLMKELMAEITAELTARKIQYNYYRDYLLDYKENTKRYEIAELADTNIGLATSVTQHKRDSGVLLIHNSDIQANKIILKSTEYVSEEFAEKNKSKLLKKGDIITVHTGDVGTSAVIDDEFDGAIGFTTITTRIKDRKKLSPKYLCHYLNSQQCKHDIESVTISDRNNLNQKSYEKLKVPVPPLDVQKRIVNVLDNFESICIDLNISLPAEIEARQKQYEYYRDLLLTFAEKGSTVLTDRQTDRQTELNAIKLIQYVFGYVMLPLSKICHSISSGKAKTKDNIGKYPVYGSTGIIAKTNEAVYNKTNILVARVGANAGYTHLAEGSYDVSDNTLIIDVKNEYNLKYVYYQLVNMGLNRYAKGGGQPLVTAGQIKGVVIAIPAMREQERIVSILDHFDTLCNDLSAGLPAEIEARQKQYEYYRDKLLSFQELPK